jgi:hypothetical protein
VSGDLSYRIGMLPPDPDLTAHSHRARRRRRGSPACCEDGDGDGGARRGSRTRRRWAESTPARLLHHFLVATCSQEVERGGALHVQDLAGGAGVVELEQAGRNEHVWEVAGDRASWFV